MTHVKRNLVLLILSALSWTHDALASQTYLTEECKSATHYFRYTGNYPLGGYYAISKIGHDNVLATLLPAYADGPYSNEEIEKTDMLYRYFDYIPTAETKVSSKDCFDVTTSFYKQTLMFQEIKAEAGERLGISEGQTMQFTCTAEYGVQKKCQE